MSPTLVWVTDSPGWGGSEVNLIRVLGFLADRPQVVAHGPVIAPELSRGIDRLGVPRYQVPTGSTVRDAFRVAAGAVRQRLRLPGATWVLWGHHADSYRWGGLAAAFTGQRYIAVEQLIPHDRDAFADSRLSLPVKRWTAGKAVYVVVNAHSQVRHYHRVFGISTSNVRAIVNSRPVQVIVERVNALRGVGQQAKAALGLPPGTVLLCVGRLAGQKDQTSLIRAWQRVPPPAVLVLVGDGPDRTELERLAMAIAPGRVRFAGHQDDPTPWLAAADIYAQPSLTEGLPGALIEALAAGLPCIATDIPGNRELVIDGVTGLTVPVRSPERLAEAIGKFRDEPDLARRLASTGQAHVEEHYDESVERQAWRTLFGELCGNSR